MRKKYFILTILAITVSCLYCLDGMADAAYMVKNRMIKEAQVIALVKIESVKKSSYKGEHWTYGQEAIAKPVQILKGSLKNGAILRGDENFICAKTTFSVGPALVFLKNEKDYLKGINWEFSSLPVKKGMLNWFVDNKSFNRKEARVANVIDEIKKELGSDELSQTPPPILSVANAVFVCSGGLGRGCFNRIRSRRSHFKGILL